MDLYSALVAVGAAAPLASRTFIPLFIVCLLAAVPEIGASLGLPAITPPESMQWLAHPAFVTALGVLAVLEVLADKSPVIKEFLDEFQVYLKSAAAVLITLMVMPPEAQQITDHVVATAGWSSVTAVVAVVAGGLTFALAWTRQLLTNFLADLDGDDVLGLRGVLSLVEDVWAALGMLLVLVLPLLALLLAGVVLALAWAWRRVALARENATRVPCPTCAHQALPTAVRCSACHGPLTPARVRDWRWFGPPTTTWDATAREAHRQRLLASGRCPDCAERVRPSRLFAKGCPHCGYRPDPVADGEWLAGYHEAVLRRGWQLFGPVAVAGLLPVIGLAVALVAIRLAVVGPARVVLPRGTKFAARWGLRLATLVLLIPAALPVASWFAVPVLYWLHLGVYAWLARRATRIRTAVPALARPAPAPLSAMPR